jgi:hypothetical protein
MAATNSISEMVVEPLPPQISQLFFPGNNTAAQPHWPGIPNRRAVGKDIKSLIHSKLFVGC